MANIARRGRDSVIQIVAFGLGLMVLLLLAVVRNDLMQQWRSSLPENAPNYFMINIRPDQTSAVREFFAQRAIEPPELVPMIRARLTQINATPVGMAGQVDGSLVEDPSWIRSDQLYFDFVYHPKQTAFLETARRAGARHDLDATLHQLDDRFTTCVAEAGFVRRVEGLLQVSCRSQLERDDRFGAAVAQVHAQDRRERTLFAVGASRRFLGEGVAATGRELREARC